MVLVECSYNASLYMIQWSPNSFIHFTLKLLCLSFMHWEKFPGMECLLLSAVFHGLYGLMACERGLWFFHLVFSCANKRHFPFLSKPKLKSTKMQGYSNRIAEVLKTKLGRSDVVHLNTKHIVIVYFFCPRLSSQINRSVTELQGFLKEGLRGYRPIFKNKLNLFKTPQRSKNTEDII